jgi:hypothetical protein
VMMQRVELVVVGDASKGGLHEDEVGIGSWWCGDDRTHIQLHVYIRPGPQPPQKPHARAHTHAIYTHSHIHTYTHTLTRSRATLSPRRPMMGNSPSCDKPDWSSAMLVISVPSGPMFWYTRPSTTLCVGGGGGREVLR